MARRSIDETMLDPAADPGGAAHRLRVGCHGDGRDVRSAAASASFPDRFNDDISCSSSNCRRSSLSPTRELHDDQRTAGDAAQPEPAERALSSIRTTSRSKSKNWSIGMQRDLGLGPRRATSAYVGSIGRQDAANEQHQCRTVRSELSSRRASTRRRAGPCRRISCDRTAAMATSS